MSQQAWISTKDAAKKLGYSPEYVTRLCKQQRLPAKRDGQTWLIDEESLRTYEATIAQKKELQAKTLSRELKRDLRQTIVPGPAPVMPAPVLAPRPWLRTGLLALALLAVTGVVSASFFAPIGFGPAPKQAVEAPAPDSHTSEKLAQLYKLIASSTPVAATSTIVQNSYPVRERIIERLVAQAADTSDFVTHDFLASQIDSIVRRGSGGGGSVGSADLAASDIPDLSGSYLSLGGGTLSGGLALPSLDTSATSTLAGITLDATDCSAYGNGGKLTTDVSGNVVCGDDSSGSGSSAASSTLLADTNTFSGTNTFSNTINGSITGNAGTVTGGVYTSTFNSLFDPRFVTDLAATTSIASITTLANLSLPYSQLTGAPAAAAYPFPSNATTTQIAFNGGATFTGATTTALAVTGISDALLKTTAGGSVVAAIAGTDYQAAGNYATFAYPFPSNATTTNITFSSGITANVTGALTGNASTATALETGRTINGVTFDGTANITVAAASSTLLANNNTFSGTNTFTSAINGSITGNAGTVTNGVYTSTFNALFDPRFVTDLAATSSIASITTLANLSLPYSQLTGAPSIAGYPFPSNATTTQLAFNGGATFNGATTTALAVTGSTALATTTFAAGNLIVDANGVIMPNSRGVSASFFVGSDAGSGAVNAVESNFLGENAGYGATGASASNFIGQGAGYGATGASASNFIGQGAGYGATNSAYSNFFGASAGGSAIDASFSNFFGLGAGSGATNAYDSNFFGERAGWGAANAANSIFIGTRAGTSDTVNNTVSGTSIAIGQYAGTGGFSNSIALGHGVINSATQQVNIGNVLYATGIYNSDTQSSAAIAGGKLGIGTTTPGSILSVNGVANFTPATSTFYSTGGINIKSGCFAIGGTCLSAASLGASTFAYPFLGNATTTQIAFNGGLAAFASSTIGDGTQEGGLTISGGATTTGTLTVQGAGTSTFGGNIGITGNIIPSANDTYSLGSSAFAWKDLFVGPGSIYVNGQEVLHTDPSQNVVVSANVNQSLVFQTSGTGDVELNPTGSGLIYLKGNVIFSGGKTFNTSDNSAITFTDGIVGGGLQLAGNVLSSTVTNSDIAFSPNGNGDSYFTNGNVGIGTTNPGSKLEVQGLVSAQRFVATSSVASVFPYASSTALSVSGALYTPITSSLLKADAAGRLVAASAGTDYQAAGNYATFAYPFPSNSTSTNITFSSGITGALTGNASTATALQTSRTINGVTFDGTSNITITAASSTLLANSNTFSGTNTFSNTINGSITGNAGTVTNGVYTGTFGGLFDTHLSATTSLPSITTLANLSLPYSQLTGTPSIAGYPFPSNATTTLLAFNGGLTAFASSTIGNGTAAGGLTVSGSATTTGQAYFGGAVTTANNTLDDGSGNARYSGNAVFGALYYPGYQGKVTLSGTYASGPESLLSFQDGATAWGITLNGSGGNASNLYIGLAGSTAEYFWRANWQDSGVAGNTFQIANPTATSLATLNALGVSGQTGDLIDATAYGSAMGSVFKVQANGSVGVGTTTPGSLLAVGDTNGINFSTATSTFSSTGGINLAGGCYAINGACLTAASLGASTFGYPFPSNATTTLLAFNGGLTAYASSTIGNGTQAGGLTVSGGATTTGTAYFAGNVGIGTNAPSNTLEVNGTGYFASGVTINGEIGTGGHITSSNSGTAASPTFGFIYDGGTGMFVPGGAGSKTLGFSTNGAERLRITSAGNVGIGTTSPGYKLDVNGAVQATGYLLNANNLYYQGRDTGNTAVSLLGVGSDNNTYVFSKSGQSIVLGAGGSEKVRITSAGNVGIGTTSPFAKLSVAGDGFITGGLTVSGSATTTGTAYFGGQVGIGAINPNVTLTLLQKNSSGLLIQGSAGVNFGNASFSLYNAAQDSQWSIAAGGGKFSLYDDLNGAGPFTIESGASADSLYVSSAGNVGVGTSSPFAKLSVNGNGFFGGSLTAGSITATTSASLASTTLSGSTLLSNATTTSFAIGNVASALLKTTANGSIVAAVAGTDYQAAGNYATFTYPFPSNATTTRIAFNGGATFTGATTTALAVTGSTTVSSVLNVGGSIKANGGVVGALTGNASTATALQTARTINNVSFNGSANITITAASSTLLANSNTFSGTNTFSTAINGSVTGNAGTVTNGVYNTTFGGLFDTRLSATTSLPNITTLANLSLPYSQLTGTPSISGYPFALAGNATSTLTQFNGGLTSYASSTIGNGTAGLTVSGNATTTGNAYFAGNVGIGGSAGISGLNGNQIALQINHGGGDAILALNTDSTSRSARVEFGSDFTNASLEGFVGLTANNSIAFMGGGTHGYPLVLGVNNTEVLRVQGDQYSPGLGNVGIGTTTPFAKLSLAANPTDPYINTTLFAIGSSTASATTTLFSVSNTGSTTVANGVNIASGCYAVGGACLSLSTLAGSVALGSQVSGILPIANGGTNAASQAANGVNYFDGTKITSGSGLTFTGTKLGIGTTTPLAALAVAGTGMGAGTTFQTTNAAQAPTFTVLDNGNVGIGTSSPGSILSVGNSVTTQTVSGAAWTEQTGIGAGYWFGITSSADGAKLVVSTQPYLRTSADGGVTWTLRTSAGNRQWNGVTSSADGTKLAAIVNNGDIYTSTDSGATWTDQTAAGSRAWSSITSSSDGTKLAAVVNNGGLYTSTDSGVTWTNQAAAGTNLAVVASSADGSKLVAISPFNKIRTSADGGVTWTIQASSLSTVYWNSVTSSADGTKLAATVNNGDIYTSIDSGATWTDQTAAGSRRWISITSSADGAKLAAAVGGGYTGDIYVSLDGGATWTDQTAAGARGWQDIVSSADGTKLAATASGNSYVYTYGSTITYDTQNSSFFTVTASSTVGIGTTSPFAALSVNAPAGATSFAIGSSTGTYFTVNPFGNVGIGTTSPFAKLSVAGDTFAAGALTVTGTTTIGGALVLNGATTTAANGVNIASGCYAVNGTCLSAASLGASTFGYPFPSNATTTQIAFNGGLTAFASSTIGNGTAGLTVSGNATTTGNAYFGGKIGIGTTTPAVPLQIAAVGNSQLRLGDNTGGFYFDIGRNSGNGIFSIQGNNSSAQNIALAPTSGSVGIGTTGLIAGHVLTVAGNEYLSGGLGIGGGNTTPGSAVIYGSAGDATSLTVNAPNAVNTSVFSIYAPATAKAFAITATGENIARGMFYVDGSYGIGPGGNSYSRDTYISRSSTSTLLISSDRANGAANLSVTGSVGIGTTSPYAKLSVTGDAVLSASSPSLYLSDTVSGSLNSVQNASGALQFNTGSGNSIVFQQGGVEAARFLTGTRAFGIGTTTPGSLLAVGDTNGINFGLATSTFNTTGGININSGCYAINGTCLSMGGGSGASLSVANAWTALQTFQSGLISQASSTFTGALTLGGGAVNYSGNSTSTVPNNTPFAWTIATSSGAAPLFAINTTSGSEQVSIGAAGADVYIGDVNSSPNLVFQNSATIKTAAGGTLTIGAGSDIVNFGTNVGIGTTTPGSIFAINGVANFTAATSTFYGTGGLNISGGCYAVNGTCLSAGGGGGGASLSVANAWTALQSFNSGLTAYASSTIGNGTATGGLTVNGGATTTGNAVIKGKLAIGAAPFDLTKALAVDGSISLMDSGDYHIDVGVYNTTSGGSVTYGASNSMHSSIDSVAIGYNNSVMGTAGSGIAIGKSNSAGDTTAAFGISNDVSSGSIGSSAFGYGNTVSNYEAGAFGLNNTVSANDAYAFGGSITNNIASSLMIGPNDAAKLTIAYTGNAGLGTTSPFANLAVQNNYGSTNSTLFAIGSSTNGGGTSASTLFSVSNTGSTTIQNGVNITSGCYAVNGVCLTTGGGGSSASSTLLSDANTFSGTGTVFTNNVGVGTANAGFAKLAVNASVAPTGSELVTNGTFTGSATGWTLQSGCSVYSSNQVTVLYDIGCMMDAGYPKLSTTVSLTAGRTYALTFDVTTNGDEPYVSFSNDTLNSSAFSDGSQTIYFTADYTGADTLTFQSLNWTTDAGWSLDNVSLREVSAVAPAFVAYDYSGATTTVLGDISNNAVMGHNALFAVTGTDNAGIGYNAGYGATNAANSNFFGAGAGYEATGADHANFLGAAAGNGATGAYESNFLGANAGNGATGAFQSNFIGTAAGHSATGAHQSNFIGGAAGLLATYASYSNFIGAGAGQSAANADNSNFFGVNAGLSATNASSSNFLGANAGWGAINAANSSFIGGAAGQGASDAANAIFIGTNAGRNDTVDNTTGGTSIAIGQYAGTGGFSNSIALGRGVINSSAQQLNIGNVLYATGIYNSDTQSSAATAAGKLGIGTSSPFAKFAIQANNGDLNNILFAIGSSTSSATTTLASIDNAGNAYFAGNVGVGTASPGTNLEVYGSSPTVSAYITGINTGGQAELQVRNSSAAGSGNALRVGVFGASKATSGGFVQNGGFVDSGTALAGGLSIMARASTGILRFYTGGSAAANERLRIDSAGNVGIGTTTPNERLDLSGGNVLVRYSAGQTYGYKTQGTGGGTNLTLWNDSSNQINLINQNFAPLALGTGGTASLTIATNGNTTIVGSGTTCVIGSGTGATSCTSDQRLKTNITPLSGSDALSKLGLIQGVTFNWADSSRDQSQQLGVIAQQVLAAFPQLVGSTTVNFKGTPGKYYTVDYGGLVSPLISAVNALNIRTGLLAATSTFATSTGTTTALSINANILYFNGQDITSIASTSATTTPESLVEGPFAAATDALKSALSAALGAVQDIAHAGVRQLGAAVYAGIGAFNQVFAETITADTVKAKELCLEDVCINKTQLQNLLNQQSASGGSTGTGGSDTGSAAGAVPPAGDAGPATSTPPAGDSGSSTTGDAGAGTVPPADTAGDTASTSSADGGAAAADTTTAPPAGTASTDAATPPADTAASSTGQ